MVGEEGSQISEYANSKEALGIRVWIDKETTEDFWNKYANCVIAEDGARFESTDYELQDGEECFILELKNYRAIPSTGGGALFILEYTAQEDSLVLSDEGWEWSLSFKEVAYYKPDGWSSVRQITESS